VITDKLRDLLEDSELSGYSIRDVEISNQEGFEMESSVDELPEFHWLEVHGEGGKDDFGRASLYIETPVVEDYVRSFIVSERVLETLQKVNVGQMSVERVELDALEECEHP
jgi:hypothetical protein